MNELNQIFDNLKESKKLPIMFIGSGITKRYTESDYDWEGLLKKCIAEYEPNPEIKYKWYKQKVISEYRLNEDSKEVEKYIGDYVERDFNLKYYEGIINNLEVENLNPLKFYISKLFSPIELKRDMIDEINKFHSLNEKMLTIITTNYDNLLEEFIFKNHETLIGQQMFTGSELGTIFKIHGSVADPDSMILTSQDYKRFENKSKVLSAKVISLFAENPVIFMGYSIKDDNIRGFLNDIFSCLETKEEREIFKRRLILIEYEKDKSIPDVGTETIHFEDSIISITKITIENFNYIYEQLEQLEDIVDLKDIKRFKNIVYDIVYDYSGQKTKVINMLDDTEDNNEVVVAVGTEKDIMSSMGVKGIKADDLFEDVIFGKLEYKLTVPLIKILVTERIPDILQGNTVIPIHKYLKDLDVEITSLDKRVVEMVNKTTEDLFNKNIRKDIEKYREADFEEFEEIMEADISKSKKLSFFVIHSANVEDFEKIQLFLQGHFEIIKNDFSSARTYLRKMIFIYDIRKNKTPSEVSAI